MKSRHWIALMAAAIITLSGSMAHAQGAAAGAAAAKQVTTLWDFLGIPPLMKNLKGKLVNPHGNHPVLEHAPPPLPIADPSLLKSEVPAIAVAAEVKAQEDLAKQKIKAIKYLAKIGCGCGDRGKKIQKAMLAAMADCTEKVRLAAVEAVAEQASGDPCEFCDEKSCCSEELVEALAKIAYERDDKGCWLEPSRRVRRAAERAMEECCPGGPIDPPVYEENGMREGPMREGPVREGPMDPAPMLPTNPEAPNGPIQPVQPIQPTQVIPQAEQPSIISSRRSVNRTAAIQVDTKYSTQLASDRRDSDAALSRLVQNWNEPAAQRPTGQVAQQTRPQTAALPATQALPATRRIAPVAASPESGVISHVMPHRGFAVVELSGQGNLPVGAEVEVYHTYFTGPASLGRFQVVACRDGLATVRPIGNARLRKVSRGDEVQVVR